MRKYIYLTLLLLSIFGHADTIYSAKNYSKSPICQDLNITKNEILTLIKNGQIITKKILNEEFEKIPCEVNGQIKVNNKIINFQYNFANYIMIRNKIIGCYHQFKGCSEKKEKKRIKVKKILQIVSDNSSYKINCKIHKRLDESTIKRFFLHSKEEQFADIIRSNDTPWSGCVQQGEVAINEKLYKFELNLGGFGYINSEDDKETYYSCYPISCPDLANFENSLENVPYDKWNVVPKKEIDMGSNTSKMSLFK